MKPTNFHDLSYLLHENDNPIENETLTELHQSWFRDDTVGFWRMIRPYNFLRSFLNLQKSTRWLTIGDGRFGIDSMTLKKVEPTLNVLPTDLSIAQLEYAKNQNWIEKFEKVNAEKVPYADNQFDYSFCKESYHHFPRPFYALYEMIRVSKKAIILIEPNDKKDAPIALKLIRQLKIVIKQMLGRKTPSIDTWNYETIGNYIYSISPREFEKVALGLNMPGFAYCYYNDYYEKGVEFAKADAKSPVYKQVLKKIRKADLKCKLGLEVYTSIVTIIFKQKPTGEELSKLKESGFTIVDLPKNPYVK